jgi:hypothetical protein
VNANAAAADSSLSREPRERDLVGSTARRDSTPAVTRTFFGKKRA